MIRYRALQCNANTHSEPKLARIRMQGYCASRTTDNAHHKAKITAHMPADQWQSYFPKKHRLLIKNIYNNGVYKSDTTHCQHLTFYDCVSRFHRDHPDPVPDLREHTRYTKKVFFDGFNSCAYRG